tara:strand:- start:1635 stop:3392 length:1758 start_codon:yes stop_codon:yes gene_type:complete
MNRKKRVTRKRVNDSVIDSVLNDVYDELDKLQASNEYNIASSNVDNQGEYTEYSAPGGANYFAINTENGWMVDVNSQFEPIAGSSFQPSVGVQGLTKLPTKHEALKYNEDLQILSHSPFKIKESSTAVTDTVAYGQIWVKTASPNQLWFTNDAGNDIQLTSGTGTTFLSNNTADTMTVSDFGASPALRINADQPATAAAEDSVGLHIDYDRIVAASGTENHNDTGLDIDINSATLGTGIVTGIDVDVVGATSGTHTAVGADINVSGADTNIGLIINSPSEHIRMQASADAANDYATISVADTGDMTIATVGDGTTDSDLLLDIDGDIQLNADGGNISFNDNLAPMASFSEGRLNIFHDATSYCRIDVNDSGVTQIVTADGTATDADFIVDAGGDITLDSGTGIFIAKNNGTEFSAANSAYAGMILGYSGLVGDGTNSKAFEIQNAVTVEDNTHKISFTTPPSENVEITANFVINTSSTDTKIVVGLSSANATDGYSAVHGKFEYDTVGVSFSDDEINDYNYTVKWILSATELAAVGSSNTFWIGFGTGGATKTAYLNYGYRASFGAGYHPFTIKATALPVTVYNG